MNACENVRRCALAKHLDILLEDVRVSKHDNCVIEVGLGRYPPTYLVLTDEEAEERARESVKRFVEEEVLSQIPEPLREYFDIENYVQDVIDNYGRGNVLSSKDESEEEISFYQEDLYDFLVIQFGVEIPDDLDDSAYDQVIDHLLDKAEIYDVWPRYEFYIYRVN